MPPAIGAIGAIGSTLGTIGSAVGAAKGIADSVGGLFGGGGGQPQATGNAFAAQLYNQRLKRAQEGEEQLMKETSQAPQELKQMQADIQAGISPEQVETMRAQNLALKKSGVRGSQAATLMGRSAGDVATRAQRDMNKMLYDDALQRRQARTSFLANKASQLPQLPQ